MEYIRRYLGGPLDGHLEKLPVDKSYPNLVIPAPRESDASLWAIYEYDRTEQSEFLAERYYKYRASQPFAVASEYVQEHIVWILG